MYFFPDNGSGAEKGNYGRSTGMVACAWSNGVCSGRWYGFYREVESLALPEESRRKRVTTTTLAESASNSVHMGHAEYALRA